MSRHKAADPLLNHEYDGIREYDNPTPGWWHVLFLLSIVFSFFYFLYYEVNPESATNESTLLAARVAETKRIFGAVGDLSADEATIQAMRGNAQFLEVAAGIFIGNCAQCHGRDGTGGTGTNLTDDEYKNVNRLEDIYAVITRGAGGQAMPAWDNRLTQNERVILAAYVANLRGSTTGGKGPEGKAIAPWPPIPAPEKK